MKNRNNKKDRQTILPATIATIFLLGGCGSVFASASKTGFNFSTFDYISSKANQNLRLSGAFAKFGFRGVQTNNFFAADFRMTAEYPKPDFSAIEKWYEVVKYEYGDLEGGDNYLYFWLKSKSGNQPNFDTVYYDKDGVVVQSWRPICESCPSEVGAMQKYYVATPRETAMEKVTTVKFVRLKN